MQLRLHTSSDNSVIIIHDEDVLGYRAIEDGKTRITFKYQAISPIVVNESTDKIWNMFEQSNKK